MRVYHFAKSEYALEDIRLRRLKLTTLDDINDPFEFAVCSRDSERRRLLRATRLQAGREFGMLCFSTDWHNPVQWSHYAEKHRGVCLGFDVPDGFLTPITYVKEPPRLDWSAIQRSDKRGKAEMLRWSTTKFEHWAYEKEWRGFVQLDEPDSRGLYFFEFGGHLRLREVIVGPASDVSRRDIQVALDALDGVKSFKARLAFRTYRVVRQNQRSMWL